MDWAEIVEGIAALGHGVRRPPATPDDIRAAEAVLGGYLDADLVELLTLANGWLEFDGRMGIVPTGQIGDTLDLTADGSVQFGWDEIVQANHELWDGDDFAGMPVERLLPCVQAAHSYEHTCVLIHDSPGVVGPAVHIYPGDVQRWDRLRDYFENVLSEERV